MNLTPGAVLTLGPLMWRNPFGVLMDEPITVVVDTVHVGCGARFDRRFWPAVALRDSTPELRHATDPAWRPWIYVPLGIDNEDEDQV